MDFPDYGFPRENECCVPLQLSFRVKRVWMNVLYFVVLSVSTEREKVLITKDIEALDQKAAVHSLGCASNENFFTFQKNYLLFTASGQFGFFNSLFIYNIYSIYFFNGQLKALLGEWSINVSIIITFEIKFTGTHLSPVDHQSKSYTPQCNQTYTTLLQSLLQHMPSVPRLLRLSLGNYVSHGFQRSMLGSGMLP